MKKTIQNATSRVALITDCTGLLVSLLALILLLPLAGLGREGALVVSLLATFIFLSGIWAVSSSHRHVVVGIALLLPPIVIEWLNSSGVVGHGLFSSANLYSLPFFIFLGVLILKFVFQPGPVTGNRLIAALCFYLLMGLIWAHVYAIVLYMAPAAFGDPVEAIPFSEIIYFSYVTLTTLGYGEITPVSMMARSLAILEAIAGVLYMGALVARLAGSMRMSEEES